jgi:predicted amidophosphoribosyltransferase
MTPDDRTVPESCCPQCGQPVAADQETCPSCAVPLRGVQDAAPPSADSNSFPAPDNDWLDRILEDYD